MDRKFDIIECVGVLHHMKDPLKGLKVLLNLLEPQGFMKLGLYSDIARQDIEQARQLIIKKNYKSEFGDIIKFRQEIIKEKKNESLKKISHRFDFKCLYVAHNPSSPPVKTKDSFCCEAPQSNNTIKIYLFFSIIFSSAIR